MGYAPKNEDGLAGWLGNFKTKLNEKAGELGVDPVKKDAILLKLDSLVTRFQTYKAKKQGMKQETTDKNGEKKDTMSDLADFVANVKTLTNYTQGIGQAMGIIAPNELIDYPNYVVKFSISKVQGGIQIKFKKKGIDGVRIYSRNEGSAEWVFVALDLYSPYLDTRGSTAPSGPGNREYMLRAFYKDEEIGLDSPVQSIMVS